MVQVTRCAWRCPGAPNLYPADAVLSLPACRPSRSLAKLAAVEAVRGSFEAAHAAITRRCGPVIGKRQAGQAVVSAARDITGFYACSGRILGRWFDLGLRHRHDRHPCLSRWLTGCW